MKGLSMTRRLLGRYARRIPLDLTQPCWPWLGMIEEHGYARLMIDGKMKYVHRVVYQLHVGPIPRGWELDHECHNAAIERGQCAPGPCPHRACWNPAHIEAVTSVENSMRGGHPLYTVARRRICSGGHDLTLDANVYTRPDGRRRCRPCQIEAQRERRRVQRSKGFL